MNLLNLFMVAGLVKCEADLGNGEKEHMEMVYKLLEGYDRNERANIDGVTNVTIDFYIQGISIINQVDMDYELTLFFRQQWHDSRLQVQAAQSDQSVKSVYDNLDSRFIKKIWIPDLFFPDAKYAERQNIMRDNALLEISTNGNVYLSQRITLKIFYQLSKFKRNRERRLKITLFLDRNSKRPDFAVKLFPS